MVGFVHFSGKPKNYLRSVYILFMGLIVGISYISLNQLIFGLTLYHISELSPPSMCFSSNGEETLLDWNGGIHCSFIYFCGEPTNVRTISNHLVSGHIKTFTPSKVGRPRYFVSLKLQNLVQK